MAQLNFFRIKPGIVDPNAAFVSIETLWAREVRVTGTFFGVLYGARSRPKLPPWVSYFEDSVDFTELGVLSSSAAAVLIVPRGERLFAVVFGYGRYLLDENVIEARFGLRAVLNAIEPTLLRAIDHKRLEGVPRHTREQLTKNSGLDQFGLDVERDLLRSVTGKPKDASLGDQLSGSDQLAVIGDVPLTRLGEQIDRYSSLADRDDYKQNFSWVDNIAEITDPVRRAGLDAALAEDLLNETPHFWLAVPDLVDWEGIAGFRYQRSRRALTHPELDLQEYFAERTSNRPVTPESLRHEHVHCVRADDGSDHQTWSVYRCLVGELAIGEERFVISEGKWFQIDSAFLDSIEREIAALVPSEVQLPRCNQVREFDYNERAARRSRGGLVLLDQDLVRYGNNRSVEACDLYSREKVFLHVKHTGASSVLSHLFSQGMVSATLLLNEVGFRTALSEKLPESHRWGEPSLPIRASEFEVAYVLIARPGRVLELPFFSKVNLRNASRMLRAFGFRVTLTSVPSVTVNLAGGSPVLRRERRSP